MYVCVFRDSGWLARPKDQNFSQVPGGPNPIQLLMGPSTSYALDWLERNVTVHVYI